MIYTTEQKKKLDAILKAFENYIDDQNYFDIVYSKSLFKIFRQKEAGGR